MDSIPSKIQVLVIGGGPAGSYAASCLARDGLEVVVLEAEKFPRYHIGESMLPSMRHFLRFIGLEEQFLEYGFCQKVGAAFRLGQNKPEGYTDFIAMDKNNFAWNVVRSEADEILFRHAANCGAKVFDETKVTEICFDSDKRPISAMWKSKDGKSGTIYFNFLVDATGRRGILSTKYLKNRQLNQSLKNIAFWAYWEGTKSYMPNTPRAGAPFFEALTDESGWAWFIPLHNGTTSIGIVMNQEIYTRKRGEETANTTEFYLKELERVPTIISLRDNARLVEKDISSPVMFASDYSYSASSYAGTGYRIIGDAAAFIDPFFSNGIHLAVSGALSAAVTICASISEDCSEAEAASWHSSRIGTSYTRFLLVVLSAYKQMRSQQSPVLADIDEDNFDRAFGHFRGIIQGYADVTTASSKIITEEELARTLDFCAQAYMPAAPEDANLERKIQLVTFLGSSETIDAVSTSSLNGRSMRLERGRLGLVLNDN